MTGALRKGRTFRDRPCSAPGCTELVQWAEYCSVHRKRVGRNGDLDVRRASNGAGLLERIDRLTMPLVETGCEVWLGYIDRGGYGRVSIDGSARVVHRVRWETVNGPVPDGLELDHLCRNKSCVRIDHLEPVTHQVNMDRWRAVA